MKIKLFFMGLILFPIFFVIFINESQRSSHRNHQFEWKTVKTINPSLPSFFKCSWVCHNETIWCKMNHVKRLKPYFSWTDPLYFGLINKLKATGNYGLANLVFLVVLIPGFCLWMLWRIIQDQRIIKEQININQNQQQAGLLVLTTSVTSVYVYCTDFIIHSANLLGWSYYEVNFLLFCVLYPVLVIGLIVIFIVQQLRLSKTIRSRMNHINDL